MCENKILLFFFFSSSQKHSVHRFTFVQLSIIYQLPPPACQVSTCLLFFSLGRFSSSGSTRWVLCPSATACILPPFSIEPWRINLPSLIRCCFFFLSLGRKRLEGPTEFCLVGKLISSAVIPIKSSYFLPYISSSSIVIIGKE